MTFLQAIKVCNGGGNEEQFNQENGAKSRFYEKCLWDAASLIDTLRLWPFLSFQCNYVKRIFAQPHSLAVLVALLSSLYFPLIIHC